MSDDDKITEAVELDETDLDSAAGGAISEWKVSEMDGKSNNDSSVEKVLKTEWKSTDTLKRS